jgi:hypothetical protein
MTGLDKNIAYGIQTKACPKVIQVFGFFSVKK